MKSDRLLARIVRGDVGNVALADLVHLVEALGFQQVGGLVRRYSLSVEDQ